MSDSYSEVRVEEVSAGRRPVLLVRREAVGPRPLVLLFHRLNETKEFELGLAYRLARGGELVAAAMDVVDPPAAAGGDAILETIVSTTVAAGAVLETLRDHPAVIPGACGAAGASLGAMIALAVTTTCPEVAACVALLGCAGFERLLGTAHYGVVRRFLLPGRGDAAPEELRAIDPWHRPERLAPRPLLMISGAMDTVIPAEMAKSFHDRLLPHYAACPRRLRYVEIPGRGHQVVPEMHDQAVAWLLEHLGRTD